MDQQPIYVFAKWRVKEEHLDNVLNLLSKLVAKSRQEEGNLFYKLHQSNIDPNTLMLYEGYKNEAAVAAHRSSPHFQTIALEKIIPLLAEREVIVTTELENG